MLAFFEQGITTTTVLAAILILATAYALLRALAAPLKFVVRVLAMAGLGLFWVMLFNIVGQFMGMSIPLNPVTLLLSGLLGPLGPVTLAVLQLLLR